MKKMAGAGHNHNPQCLRLRPSQHCSQRHHIILVAVNDQGIIRDTANIEASHRGCNQHQLFGRQAFYHARLHESAEGKPSQHQRQIAELAFCVLRHRQHVLRFALALIETALAFPRAAQIRPQRNIAQIKKRFGQRMHYFIVESAAKQRVGMCDQRYSAAFFSRIVDDGLQLARRPIDKNLF